MKYTFTILLCLGFLFATNMNAQEDDKKVVIIKKVQDEDGKVTTERQEASGKDADSLIKKMKEDGTLEDIDIEIEIEEAKKGKAKNKKVSKNITVEKSMKDGKEVMTYKIVTENDGEKRVMFWDGDGEMPAEMAEIMKNDEIKTGHSEDGERMIIRIETDDEDEEHEMHKEREMHEKHMIKKRTKKESKNKVSLGIMIEDDSQGVAISDVIAESVAHKSGLKAGDIILKVNDTYIFNTDMLLKTLSKFDKGDKIKVTYLREGKEKKTDAKF